MNLPIVVFEDEGWENLIPLTWLRPACLLVCGFGSLLERVQHQSQAADSPALWTRPQIAALTAEETGLFVNEAAAGAALFLNGRSRWEALPEPASHPLPWVGIAEDGQIACIAADGDLAARLAPELLLHAEARDRVLAGVPRYDIGSAAQVLDFAWDFIHTHLKRLGPDMEARGLPGMIRGTLYPGAHLLNASAIYIGAGSRVKPAVVIDAEEGPVYIGENVTILPHAYIQGPAYVGDDSVIQTGAIIRDGSWLGPVSKAGGEVEGTIIQGFSNKQHSGFLGHCYVGQWVNIAADAINSDLKNTYGNVRMQVGRRSIDTGQTFMGAVIGDHAKIGINAAIPTGASIGLMSNVIQPLAPKFVPSFHWIVEGAAEIYGLEKGLEVARRVMARRRKELTAAAVGAMRAAFDTAPEHEAALAALAGTSQGSPESGR